LVYLLLKNRRQAFRFAAILSFLLAISAYLLDYRSEGGFIWSTVVATQNPLSLDLLVSNFEKMATPAFFTLLGLSGFVTYLVLVRFWNKAVTHPLILNAIYFLTTSLWLVASIGRLGADTNYFIESLYASVWLLLTWADEERSRWVESKTWNWALLLIGISFAWTVFAEKNEPRYVLAPYEHLPSSFQKITAEIVALNTSPHPKILNIAEPHHALSVGWDLYLNDPYLYSILWHTKKLSNRPLLDAIDKDFFDVIVLARGSQRESFSDPPLHDLYQAIFARYELRAEGAYAYFVQRSAQQ
jgi:hypothetical protein